MPWTRKLPAPITLKDGRSLASLADARAFIKSLPARQRRSEQLLYAGGLMTEAASGRGVLHEAAIQLRRALRAEGLV
jgi:hypothetical protein